MGADIYLIWKGMTESDKKKQITGFDVTCGRFGYLRGAYNGRIGFEALQQLFEGVNWEKDWEVNIKLLKKNLEILEKGLFISNKKQFLSINGKDLEIQSYRDFVKLAEDKIKQGLNPKVHFSY
jgi:hypothetical protein